MQQVLVIHGGHAHNSDEAYQSWLRDQKVRIEKEVRGWKQNLQERLGDEFEIIRPTMPCKQNAKYVEWEIWFEKYLPFVRDDVVLIGHSLGGIFLAKYLNEHKIPVQVRATLLVAAPMSGTARNPEQLADFNLQDDLSKLERQGGHIVLYHSRDDQVVPFSNAKSYQENLPAAELVAFNNRGHFNGETFTELEDKLRELAG